MEGRRYEMNLEGLLRIALDSTEAEDTTVTSGFQQMDEERKQFIENAMKSMTVDIIEEFKTAIDTLSNETESIERKAAALNVVRSRIDYKDFANNFVQLGGTSVLLKYLTHESNELRVSVNYIIAEMSQGNPFCQQHFLDAGIYPQLLAAMKESDKDIASSAIHAISALLRNFDPGLVEFIKLLGLVALLDALKTRHSKVFVKACFLIAALSSQSDAVRDKFAQSQAVEALAPHVETVSAYDIKVEAVLFALAEVSAGSGGEITPQTKSELETVLKDLITLNKDLPECEEVVSYATVILNNMAK